MKGVLGISCFGKGLGIFVLLFAVLLFPMLHGHPAIDHAHGKTEGHQHQATIHADFFPVATHGHSHHDGHERHEGDLEVSMDPSQHAFSHINFHSLQLTQSFPFSSFFKKQALSLDPALPKRSIFRDFQSGILKQAAAPLRQTPRFSPPSLRAPPYFV